MQLIVRLHQHLRHVCEKCHTLYGRLGNLARDDDFFLLSWHNSGLCRGFATRHQERGHQKDNNA